MPLVSDQTKDKIVKAHPLNDQKKEILRQLAGSASFEHLDFNKIRETTKDEDSRF